LQRTGSLLLAPFALLLLALGAAAQDDAAFSALVREALDAPQRSEAERARDANRKPVETLAFFGIEPDMRVLELIPGGGWYTGILAPALREDGELLVWVGFQRYAERLAARPGLEGIRLVAEQAGIESTERRGIYTIEPFSLGVKQVDAALTFRNLHNLTPESRANLHRAVFEALKPGGVYGVVDHTRRHMQPDDPENRRRLDPVVAIEEIVAAGFRFDGWSDLHYRPDDELRYEVGRRSVAGNTDRFTLRFRKPD